MLVYIRLHNAHLGIYMFMASGWVEGESLSNLRRAARRANTVGVRAAEFPTPPGGRGLGCTLCCWCNARSRKVKETHAERHGDDLRLALSAI